MNKETTFYDIYDYIYTPFWQTKHFLVLLASILAIACLIGIFFWIRHVKNKNQIKPTITPWESALRELRALTPHTYETKEEFKKFYFTITRIIKKYFEKQFSFDVIDKTDDELIDYLQSKNLDTKQIQKLKIVLNGSLLIKYANAQALREQAQSDLKTVISLVKQTAPSKGL
ncbi:hypothetical protein KKA53_04535 [Candidatus Dependentiae bacterium]|nr:hypothetical protein [Candidatus Dependentiae bacterium]